MSKDHEGDYRAFYQLSRAWYAPHTRKFDKYLDEIMIGFYSPDGGTSGEFCMRWYDLGKYIAPKLEAFDDSWHAFAQCSDLIAALAERDGQNITPSQCCDLLLSLGFVDRTPIDDDKRAAAEKLMNTLS